jgi:hypothetical protein
VLGAFGGSTWSRSDPASCFIHNKDRLYEQVTKKTEIEASTCLLAQQIKMNKTGLLLCNSFANLGDVGRAGIRIENKQFSNPEFAMVKL